MASNSSEEWVTKLQEALTDLKISSVNVESKLDQLQQGLQKLEIAMDAMKDVTSTQETRIQLLESICRVHSIEIPSKEDLIILLSEHEMK